jgi:demethylmenaquinone methyltransferase/2-methoxy-6-polyprenyl-1,4-benzoquinol methylase
MPINVVPYKASSEGKKEQVAVMFNNIAHRYDFLNHLLSLGIDKMWRKKVIRMLAKNNPKNILDVATGTADFAIEALRLNPDKITGVDISEGMLELGKKKVQKIKAESKIELLLADSESLPFEKEIFDAVTVGFGVRNFENLEKGLSEIYRVLKPGGSVAILEFSKPDKFPVKQLYDFYFKKITPMVGGFFSKDSSAYTYLPQSVASFPEKNDFIDIIKTVGFINPTAHLLSFGIASIYVAKK